jgi:RHS repeat-associated protein
LRHIDDLVLRDLNGGSPARLYALHDAMSVTAVVDTTATVKERYGYNGFGQPRFMNSSFVSSSSSYTWETLFDAYRWDSETGFYQVRYRYLHPTLGRWLTRDPIQERGGINLYNFLLNNSINRIDRDGLLSRLCRDPKAAAACIAQAKEDFDLAVKCANDAMYKCLAKQSELEHKCEHDVCGVLPPVLVPLCVAGCAAFFEAAKLACILAAVAIDAAAAAIYTSRVAACNSGATISVPVDAACPPGFMDVGIGY